MNGGSAASYGGNQSWFGEYGTLGDSKIFCDGTRTGSDIDNYGCGIIAVADMFMYMALGDSKYNPTYDSDIPSQLELGNEFCHIGFDKYLLYVITVSKDFDIINIANNIGIMAIGPFEDTLFDGIRSISIRNHMGLSGEWAPTTNNKKCLEIMKKMLTEDIPIIFSYHAFLEINSKPIYNFIDGKFVEVGNQKIQSHYMIVTGLIEYSEDVKTLIGFERMLKVATWGQLYYMNYDDIGDNLTLGTNIFQINKSGE